MKKVRKIFCLIISILLGIVLVGCGGEKEKGVRETLVYGQLSDPKTLDPQNSTDNYSQVAITQIYDRLFEIDEKNNSVVPSLVKEYQMVDGKTLKVVLKSDVKFSNGDLLTAEDVKYTLERAKNNAKVAHLYKPIVEIKIIDDKTLEIVTDKPFAPILNHLSHKSASIVNKKAVEKEGDKHFENPVGTGAYKVSKWIVGESITLERVDSHFKGIAKIKTVVIKAVPEENSRVIGLETGEIQMVYDVPAISWESLEKTGKVKMTVGPSTTTAYMGMNVTKGILQDKEVRKAIAIAIDRKAINDSMYLGKLTLANQFLSPVVFGYNKDATAYEYDVEKAKKIIADKGLVGKELKVVVSSPERLQFATIIQAQLKEIGLNLNIELLEWGAFLNATGKGQVEMFIMGWGPSTYDGDYGLYPIFNSAQKGDGGNRMFYSNPKVDELLENARVELDRDKRLGYYVEIEKILKEDMPAIPLFYNNMIYGHSAELKGVEITSYPNFFNYQFSEK